MILSVLLKFKMKVNFFDSKVRITEREENLFLDDIRALKELSL
jgi:hypothetical protein